MPVRKFGFLFLLVTLNISSVFATGVNRTEFQRLTAIKSAPLTKCDKIEQLLATQQISLDSCKQTITSAKTENCSALFESDKFKKYMSKCDSLAASSRIQPNNSNAGVPAGIYRLVARKPRSGAAQETTQNASGVTDTSSSSDTTSGTTTGASNEATTSTANNTNTTDRAVGSTTENEVQTKSRECSKLVHLFGTPSATGQNCHRLVRQANEFNCFAITQNPIFQNAEKNCKK